MEKALIILRDALIFGGKFVGFLILVYAAVFVLEVAYIVVSSFTGNHHGKARQITCMSNMKQLGLAMNQYVQDNDENMPDIAAPRDDKTSWRAMIYPDIKASGAYRCPSRNDTITNPDGLPRSYAANYTGNYSGSNQDKGNGVFAGPGSEPIHWDDVKHPESLIELCEVWHSRRPDFNIDNLGAFNPNSDMLWAGHFDRGNYLFADGHVKNLPPLATKDMWHRDASIPLSAGAVKVLENAHKEEGK